MQIRADDNELDQVGNPEHVARVASLVALEDIGGDLLDEVQSLLHLAGEDELIDQFISVQVVLRHDSLALEHEVQLGVSRMGYVVLYIHVHVSSHLFKDCLLQQIVVVHLADLFQEILEFRLHAISKVLRKLGHTFGEIVALDLQVGNLALAQ